MAFKVGDAARGAASLRRPCWRKRQWPSQGAAEAQRRSLLRRGKARDPARIEAYGPCPFCGQWHIGNARAR